MKIFLLFLLLSIRPSFSQPFFRIKTDFTIKQKNADNSSSLTIGTAYYDKLTKKLVYKISFPENEIWVFHDTTLYVFKNNKFSDKKRSILLPVFSIFHLALSNKLSDYGLNDSPFKLHKVERENGMVISTYKPVGKMTQRIGNILLSSVKSKLNGVIFYTPKNEMAAKMFYKNYVLVSGLSFPTVVTQFTYSKGESLQQTTYKNILIDQIAEENMYNYNIIGY